MKTIFAERFRELRKNNNLTQAGLASAIGITDRTCRAYESGDIEPTMRTLLSIAEYLNVSIDYLTGHDAVINENISLNDADNILMLPESEKALLLYYRNLTEEGQDYVHQQMNIATSIYKKRKRQSVGIG